MRVRKDEKDEAAAVLSFLTHILVVSDGRRHISPPINGRAMRERPYGARGWYYFGSVKKKVLPVPGSDSTQILPP